MKKRSYPSITANRGQTLSIMETPHIFIEICCEFVKTSIFFALANTRFDRDIVTNSSKNEGRKKKRGLHKLDTYRGGEGQSVKFDDKEITP